MNKIKTEIVNHTLWVSLNNIQTSNSITYELIDELVLSISEAEMNTNIRVVVLTGEGKNFCSGGDLNNMQNRQEMFAGESNELRISYEQGIQRISKALDQFSKPLIALVNGAAAGAGCDIACMCDIRVGTPNTKLLESFVKIGLVPGDGGTFFLQRVVGFAKAMELSLTGRVVLPEEALRIGLLNHIFEESVVRNEVQKIAEQISANAPIAVQLTKKALKISYQKDLNTVLDVLSAYQGIAQRTSDHAEAMLAVAEKRIPQFTNK